MTNVSALEFALLSSHDKICIVQLQFPQALPSKPLFICLKDLILFSISGNYQFKSYIYFAHIQFKESLICDTDMINVLVLYLP